MKKKTVALVVRAYALGMRKNMSPLDAKTAGLKGTFYLHWWEKGKEKWLAAGTDPASAFMAKKRKERELRGLRLPVRLRARISPLGLQDSMRERWPVTIFHRASKGGNGTSLSPADRNSTQ